MNYPNTKKPRISFFCPAYNDEKNLPILIPKVFNILKSTTSSFEIVIIDDASPDGTGKIADELSKRFKPYIRVVHHKINRDYGGAIRSGFVNATKYEYVFYTDGDNQYDVKDLRKMLEFIPEFDAVIGYRKRRALSAARFVQSNVYNNIVRTFFSIDEKDVGCAFRLIKSKYLRKIPFHSTSAFVQVEVLIGLKKQNAKIKEIPVSHSPRKFGRASGGKPKVILHTVLDMMLYRFFS